MEKLKVFVTGASGLVGSRFVELNQDLKLHTPDLPEFDITNPSIVEKEIEKFAPDWIINFAAYTDVNAAELQSGDETGLAWKINVGGVENILKAFKSNNIIHISTDMVFPGTIEYPGPYSETDIPPSSRDHLTWYGWTKNQAEKAVVERGGSVLRIIYPVRAQFPGKLDYIRSVLKRFAEGKMYPLFDDQQISIAYIDEIATTLRQIINLEETGVFHTSSDTTNPYDLMYYVLQELGQDPTSLQRASIKDFLANQPNPNRYPVWGGLKSKNTEEALDLHFSTWQTVVDRLIAQGLCLPEKS